MWSDILSRWLTLTRFDCICFIKLEFLLELELPWEFLVDFSDFSKWGVYYLGSIYIGVPSKLFGASKFVLKPKIPNSKVSRYLRQSGLWNISIRSTNERKNTSRMKKLVFESYLLYTVRYYYYFLLRMDDNEIIVWGLFENSVLTINYMILSSLNLKIMLLVLDLYISSVHFFFLFLFFSGSITK